MIDIMIAESINNKAFFPNQQSVVALRSSESMLSRNQSISSIEEDFLPTFESEDYDWRRFGWLLDEDSIELPCIRIQSKSDLETRTNEGNDKPLTITIPPRDEQQKSGADSLSHSEHSPVQWSICSEASSRDYHTRALDELSEEGNTNMEKIERANSPDSEASTEDSFFCGRPFKRKNTIVSVNDELSQPENDDHLERELKKKMSLDENNIYYGECSSTKSTKNESSDSDSNSDSDENNDGDDEPVAKRTRRSSIFKNENIAPIKPYSPQIEVPAKVSRKLSKQRKRPIRKRSAKSQRYCVCRTPYDPLRLYVGCDRCYGWFHPRCIGISEREAVEADHFYCPKCIRNSK